MAKYRKYDIAAKVQYVEGYLELLETDPNLTIADYAYSKDLADSTFNDWLIKYKKDKNKFINSGTTNSEEETVVDLSNNITPTFIEISRDKPVAPVNQPSCTSTIKLSYKDVSLEFNSDELNRVMEIIRRW